MNGFETAEAELIAELFERIAEGSTTIVEARRFNTLGMPLTRRYGGGKEVLVSTTGVWPVSRINFIIRNPVYKGLHVFRSRGGPIEREVPALVSPELWQAANDRLKRNKSLALRNGTRKNLLCGLIRCADCGYMYAGSPSHSRSSPNWEGYYYRCSSQLGVVHPDPTKRCRAKMIPAAYLEHEVWQDCRNFILNPGEALAEAQRQLRERLEQAAGIEAERERLRELLAEKEAERERVMTLFRRGHISLSEAEVQLDLVGREMADLRALIDSLAAQVELAKAWEARVVEATVLLARLRERLADIEARDDWDAKRQVVETLVQEIIVQTERDGKHKRGTITIRYAFGEPRHAVVSNTNTNAATVLPAPRITT